MKYIYSILLCAFLFSCTNSNQSVIKTDDDLTANIKLQYESYVANDFSFSDFSAAVFSDGSLSLTIINNLVIPLGDVDIQLKKSEFRLNALFINNINRYIRLFVL